MREEEKVDHQRPVAPLAAWHQASLLSKATRMLMCACFPLTLSLGRQNAGLLISFMVPLSQEYLTYLKKDAKQALWL